MPKSSAISRQIAAINDRDKQAIERPGLRAAARTAFRLRRAAAQRYRQGGDPATVVWTHLAGLRDVLVDGMALAHKAGERRARLIAQRMTGGKRIAMRTAEPDPYRTLLRTLKGTHAAMPPEYLALKNTYLPHATSEIGKTATQIEKVLREATEQIVRQGAHVREGVQIIGKRLSVAGVDSIAPYTLETIFRTQTGMAYQAGALATNKDPAIDEILWGYEYVTVGDDRVRPNHALLDGVKLPKDHPRWAEITPLNGYNCRCMLIDVFFGGETIEPAGMGTFEYESGKVIEVRPGADPGWAFNPLDMLEQAA